MKTKKRDAETILIYGAAALTLLGTATIIVGLTVEGADRAETWAAGAGWFTAAVTLYAAALVRDTLVTTRDALAEAGRATAAAEGAIREQKRIGEAQVRAYVTATKLELHVPMSTVGDAPDETGEWEKTFPSGLPLLFHLVIHFENRGQSPALDIRLEGGEFEIAYADGEARKFAAEAYRPNWHIIGGRPRTVPSGQASSMMTALMLDSKPIERWNDCGVMIEGFVTLAWEDVFGQSWRTTSHVYEKIGTPTEEAPTAELTLRPGPQEASEGPTLAQMNAQAEMALKRLMNADIDELTREASKYYP